MKKTIASIFAAALAFAPVSHASTATTVLDKKFSTSSLDGAPFRFDCTKDVEIVNGSPRLSMEGLGRINSHLHGARASKGQRNKNLYQTSNRQDNLKKAAQSYSFTPQGRQLFYNAVNPKIEEYDAQKSLTGKRAFIQRDNVSHGFTNQSAAPILDACTR